jgi:succinate-semialdehyde dehydrogenase/glutarate-semialdehyde dehydrogenase
MEYRVVNPSTGVTDDRTHSTSDAELDQALGAAVGAGAIWRERSASERAASLRRAAELFRADRAGLAEIAVREMGKPIGAALGEVDLAARIFEYYGEAADDLLADMEIHSPLGTARVRAEAVGTILGIMPWNFPYYQVVRFVAPNLLLGNSILLKPAPSCPESAAAIERILVEAGVTVGAYATIYTSNDQTLGAIADDRVRGVSITGSERAGRAVAEAAGRALKKCVLELGGSDALLVLDRDSLEQAAEEGVTARIANSGQVCTSPKRMIVLDEFYDEFVARAQSIVADVVVGDPSRPETQMGPMSSETAAVGIAAQVEDAISLGATAAGWRSPAGPTGAWLEPVVLTGITPQMRAWYEEIFGPVVSIYRAADEDDAVAIANGTRYGLSASIYSTSPEQRERVARRLDVGMVFFNSTAISLPELPFGGTKSSGFGRELGLAGLTEFANMKLIHSVAAPGSAT